MRSILNIILKAVKPKSSTYEIEVSCLCVERTIVKVKAQDFDEAIAKAKQMELGYEQWELVGYLREHDYKMKGISR